MVNKILVVDDESSFLSGFSMALNRVCNFNGEIRTASNGTDAIHKIGSGHYDVCFLDVNLPDISGLDVMKKIKQLSPETRVIIMTGSVLDDDMKSDIDRDAYMFIPKPIELDTIKAFIDREMGIEKRFHSAGKSGNNTPNDEMSGEKRKHERTPCTKIAQYSVSIFYDWELKSDLAADIINISEGGVGIRTGFPVAIGNVLRFDQNFQRKKGIVKWWAMDDQRYRAGIKFM
jgi:DNA-binding NtrC family response regulator